MSEPRKGGKGARVDSLVGEGGYKITAPEDSAIGSASNSDQSVGGTGPTGWWRYGLGAIVVLVLLVVIIQFFAGNRPAPVAVTPAPATSSAP